jgi:hypothetical protein
MKISERVAVGRQVEATAAVEAAARQQATRAKKGQKVGERNGNGALSEPCAVCQKQGPDNESEPCVGCHSKGSDKASSSGKAAHERQTATRAAAAAGMSRATYEHARAVVQAAEDCPAVFASLVEEMDRTGNVNGAYRQLKGMEKLAEQVAKRDEQKAASLRRKPSKNDVPTRYTYSAYLKNWVECGLGGLWVLEYDHGKMSTLLAEVEKWNWREVEDYLLPQLQGLREMIDTVEKEIVNALTQRKTGVLRGPHSGVPTGDG